jgi:putative membrane protein
LGAGSDRDMITAVKFLHIAALAIWCAGLVGLPLVLAKHDADHEQLEYSRLRVLTHRAYTSIFTPAAVIAITMGTALVFMRGVFVPWMFAKLVGVGVLVLLHAWIGHITVTVGERQGNYDPPRALPLLTLSITASAVIAILLLVLGKPQLSEGLVPDWLLRPLYQPLPVAEVPS